MNQQKDGKRLQILNLMLNSMTSVAVMENKNSSNFDVRDERGRGGVISSRIPNVANKISGDE